MAVSVTEVVSGWRLPCHSGMYQYQRKFSRPNAPLLLQNLMPVRFTSRTRRSERSCVVPRAMDPQPGDQNSNTYSQEDLWYVGKLVVGSIAGGAVIKYGSALFPEITAPNIVLALIIIATPVLLAVFLLTKESFPKS